MICKKKVESMADLPDGKIPGTFYDAAAVRVMQMKNNDTGEEFVVLSFYPDSEGKSPNGFCFALREGLASGILEGLLNIEQSKGSLH